MAGKHKFQIYSLVSQLIRDKILKKGMSEQDSIVIIM